MTDEVEPRFLIHQATHLFVTEPVFFQLVQMNNSMLVWAGKKSGKLNELSVAVPSFGSHNSPSATTVLGQDVSELGRNLAPLKYKQQFYVSLDSGSQDPMMNAFIEKKLTEMIKMALT
ncbi:hypothetical protein CLU79DRAFT_700955 [Phycomyces nitens]|nr:hypothetical protein CLU79DRAFT_700955 [Phycomyces nitens]